MEFKEYDKEVRSLTYLLFGKEEAYCINQQLYVEGYLPKLMKE